MQCKMLCSYNDSTKTGPLYFILQNDQFCPVEFLSIICYICYTYILILLFVRIKWLSNKSASSNDKIIFWKHNMRCCLTLLILLCHLMELGEITLKKKNKINYWYSRAEPTIALIVNIICQFFYYEIEKYNEFRYLIVTSIYWFICALFRALIHWNTFNLGLNLEYVRHTTSLLICMLCSCLVFIDFSLFYQQNHNVFRNDISKKEKTYSYKHSFVNWYSKITFCWLTPIIYKGYTTCYNISHFEQLPLTEKSILHFNKLQQVCFDLEKKTTILKKDICDGVNLWRCFVKCYGKAFIFGGVLKLLADIIAFLPALGISIIVRYIENLKTQPENNDNFQEVDKEFIKWSEFFSNGYIMCFVIFVSILSQGTLSQNSTHIVNVEGIRLKNGVQAIIYHKLLSIRKNNIKKNDYENNCDSIGYQINLITEDICNVMSCFWIGNYIWAIPIKITISIYLLYQEVGVSSVIVTVLYIVTMLTLQLIVGKKMSKNYEIISKWNNMRLRRINEILQGIRFVKLYCWESFFYNEISQLRNKELNGLNLDSVYWTCITFLANTSSIVIASLTFTLHYFMKNETIPLGRFFTCLALFNQLTVPLFIFPVIVPIIGAAVNSVKRIEAFLSLPEFVCLPQKIKFERKEDQNNEDTKNEYEISLTRIVENNENENENETKIQKLEIIRVRHLVTSWNDSVKPPLLCVENLIIYDGTLNMIIGGKGSGKTFLLNALLNLTSHHSGKVQWKKPLRIGYVPQLPWLLNNTIRENILFGCPYEEKHFSRVVQMCALKLDIDLMPYKEYTIVGDKGIALSGGQKQRIMIARMFYCKPQIAIMDNPFSSLDHDCTNYIFENIVRRFMSKKNRTVIMTTTLKKFLSYADQVIVMEDYTIKATGTLANVTKIAPEQVQALDEFKKYEQPSNLQRVAYEESCKKENSSFMPLKRRKSTLSDSRYFSHDLPLPTDDCDNTFSEASQCIRNRRRSRAATVTECSEYLSAGHTNVFRVCSLQTHATNFSQNVNWKRLNLQNEPHLVQDKCTTSDTNEIQDMSSHDKFVDNSALDAPENNRYEIYSYVMYIKSCGYLILSLYLAFTFGWQIIRILANFCLTSSFLTAKISQTQELNWSTYQGYVLLSLTAIIMSFLSTTMGQYAGSISRRFFHKRMLKNILMCPAHHFDRLSLGQILNCFSTDVEVLDKKISTSTQRLIQFTMLCGSAILVDCIITPWFVILVVPTALLYYAIQKFYHASSKKLQHLENTFKSSLIEHYCESFDGLEVIRAFNQEDNFFNVMLEKADDHTNVFLILNSANRWLGIMLDYLGGFIVLAVTGTSLVCFTIEPTLQMSSFLGLAINYSLLLPIYLTWVVKFSADLTISIGAVSRIRAYINAPKENYNNDAVIAKDWFYSGSIRFENITLQYFPQGHHVIRNLNLSIPSGQKIGICGRTGSGKSSLIMSLVRMVPSMQGKIFLDDVNVVDIPLELLRSKISVVPQDVILFSGSIRKNLDLKEEFTDEELWHSLTLVRMRDVVISLGGLEAVIQDGGLNLSAAERQLVCLAKAILKNTPCLVLDEATNSLQSTAETEFFEIILNIFHDNTVIVINHRASSLTLFERIIVMDKGTIIEDGSPKKLLQNCNSEFYALVQDAR